MANIVQNGNPVLRKKAHLVPISNITSKEIKDAISKMKKALAGESDGVAIAAPQIGLPLRIFVVAGKIFDEDWKRGKGVAKKTTPEKQVSDLVFINPEITKLSKKTKWLLEGCLSVRPLYGEVKRSLNASIRAYDENGKKFERGAGGLLAQIFQHETDHLDGVLFIDKARDLHESKPEEEF